MALGLRVKMRKSPRPHGCQHRQTVNRSVGGEKGNRPGNLWPGRRLGEGAEQRVGGAASGLSRPLHGGLSGNGAEGAPAAAAVISLLCVPHGTAPRRPHIGHCWFLCPPAPPLGKEFGSQLTQEMPKADAWALQSPARPSCHWAARPMEMAAARGTAGGPRAAAVGPCPRRSPLHASDAAPATRQRGPAPWKKLLMA